MITDPPSIPRTRRFRAYDAETGWAGVIPAIAQADASGNMTRQSSGTQPARANVLIALQRHGFVVVRNCFSAGRFSDDELLIENMGALCGEATNHSHRYTLSRSLGHCKEQGFKVERAPFRVHEGHPHFMLDLPSRDFDLAWRVALRGPKAEDILRADRHLYLKKAKRPELRTIVQVAVEQYREEAGVYSSWSAKRIRDIAAQCGLTTDELATLAAWDEHLMQSYLESDIATNIPKAVKLHLFSLEQVINYARWQKPAVSIFPSRLLEDAAARADRSHLVNRAKLQPHAQAS